MRGAEKEGRTTMEKKTAKPLGMELSEDMLTAAAGGLIISGFGTTYGTAHNYWTSSMNVTDTNFTNDEDTHNPTQP
jgi:hypothetical protein